MVGADAYIRGVGPTGQLSLSTDDFASMSDLATPATLLPNCDVRLLTSLQSNRDIVVTACESGNSVAYSLDNGQHWTSIDTSGLPCNGVSSIAVAAGKLFFSCANDWSYSYAY